MSITLDEWMKELDEVVKGPATECVSRADLMIAWDCSVSTTTVRMGLLVREGRLVYAGRERRMGRDTVYRLVPVYRLVKVKGKKS